MPRDAEVTSHWLTIDGKPVAVAKVSGWGTARYARRVFGLGGRTKDVKAAIAAGRAVLLLQCPRHRGETIRRVVNIGGRLMTRMPTDNGTKG